MALVPAAGAAIPFSPPRDSTHLIQSVNHLGLLRRCRRLIERMFVPSTEVLVRGQPTQVPRVPSRGGRGR